VRIEPTLQVVGHPDLFAVGDCASSDAWPWMKKAGVYAVRQGPVLDANLRALLTGRPLRAYRPQRDFLTLLNLGERRALGSKWGFAVEGGWVFRLKDRIDRGFMRRFQVLAPDATPAAAFPGAEKMGVQKMSCGGCAAKLDASALERALGRLPRAENDDSVVLGLSRPDDAAAFTLPRGDTLLTSVDAFSAFTDDPWLVGRVAAVNALSDIYATGGRPRHALAMVTVPKSDGARSEETLYQVLAGIRAALDPLGVSLVGGHTTRGASLFVGLTVTGELEPSRSLLCSDALQVGDRLVLTKPLGTGVVLAADMQGLAKGAWVQAAHASLIRVNCDAMEIAHRFDVRACTDVTGFGLAGHLAEMLRASGTSARVTLDALPALDGAFELLARGVRSSAHAQNASDRDAIAFVGSGAAGPAMELLFDPQTSGGLLLSIPESRSREAAHALRSAGDRHAVEIGSVMPARKDGVLFEVE